MCNGYPVVVNGGVDEALDTWVFDANSCEEECSRIPYVSGCSSWENRIERIVDRLDTAAEGGTSDFMFIHLGHVK
jgi:hypothetical protein